MDAGREVAQLLDRRLRVGERAVDELARASGSLVEALARELQLDHQRHEPLLRAVVQVAAEPPALGVAGLDEARARGAQRLQPRAQLDLQPRVLERQRGGGRGLAQQLRRLAQRRRRARARRRAGRRGRSRSAPGLARRLGAAARRGRRSRAPAASRRPRATGRRAPSASASRTPRGSCGEPLDQPRRRRGAEEARAHQPDQERGREQRERGEEHDLDAVGGDPTVCVAATGAKPSTGSPRRAEHRLEPAALDVVRGPPAAEQQHDRRRRSRTPRERLDDPDQRPRAASSAISSGFSGSRAAHSVNRSSGSCSAPAA